MSQDLGDAVLRLTTDSSQLDAGLKESEGKTSKFTDTVKGLIAAYVSFESVKKVVDFLKDCAAEYLESEKALTLLASALRSTGEYSTLAVTRLASYAASLQNTTKFSDEATMGALSMMMTIGGMTSKMATEMIPHVQDFATAMGVDLGSAATLVAKAVEGNVGALGRYGIKINGTLDEQGRLSAITKELADRFDGLAQSVGETAGGRLVQLTNAFSDMKEEIGRALVSSFNPFLVWLTNVTKGVAETMKAANDLRDALNNQAKGIGDTNDALTVARQKYHDLWQAIQDVSGKATDGWAVQKATNDYMASGAKSVKEYTDNLISQLNVQRRELDALIQKSQQEQIAADAKAAQMKAQAILDEIQAKEEKRQADWLYAYIQTQDDWIDRQMQIIQNTKDQMAVTADLALEVLNLAVAYGETSAAYEQSVADQEYIADQHALKLKTIEDQHSQDIDAYYKKMNANYQDSLDDQVKADQAAANKKKQIADNYEYGMEQTFNNIDTSFQDSLDAQMKAAKDFYDEVQKLATSFQTAADAVTSIGKDLLSGDWQSALIQVIQYAVKMAESYLLAAAAQQFLVGDPIGGAALLALAAAVIAGDIFAEAAINSTRGDTTSTKTPAPLNPADYHISGPRPDDAGNPWTPNSPSRGASVEPIHVVVNLDSRPILDAVTRGSRNKQVLITARSVVP